MQDQAPSVAWEVVGMYKQDLRSTTLTHYSPERIFEEDIGNKPEYFFKYFEREPIAAASLAQVPNPLGREFRYSVLPSAGT